MIEEGRKLADEMYSAFLRVTERHGAKVVHAGLWNGLAHNNCGFTAQHQSVPEAANSFVEWGTAYLLRHILYMQEHLHPTFRASLDSRAEPFEVRRPQGPLSATLT
jgi:hypothetical protein